MKLDYSLHRYQVPEWRAAYVDYGFLKRSIRLSTSLAVKEGNGVDFTDFINSLEQEKTKATKFFGTQYQSISTQLNALHDRYGVNREHPSDLPHCLHNIDLIGIVGAMKELRIALRQLLWFGFVNFKTVLRKLVHHARGLPKDQKERMMECRHFSEVEGLCRFDLKYLDHQVSRISPSTVASKVPSLLRKCSDLLPLNIGADAIYLSLRTDEVNRDLVPLLNYLRDSHPAALPLEEFYFDCLYIAVLYKSDHCVDTLLSSLQATPNLVDQVGWLIAQFGRGYRWGTQRNPPATSEHRLFVRILNHIHHLGKYPLSKDGDSTIWFEKDKLLGRLPLHHAVSFGLYHSCQQILNLMDDEKRGLKNHLNPILIRDSHGYTPIHLAVRLGHARLTEILAAEHRRFAPSRSDSTQMNDLPGDLLTLAVSVKSLAIVQILLAVGVDLKYKDCNDETALHLAVKFDRTDYVKLLIKAITPLKGSSHLLNACESINGRSPFILACMRGDTPIMKSLLEAGADPSLRDHFGWTGLDHAAYRGYLPMARSLAPSTDQKTSIKDVERSKRFIGDTFEKYHLDETPETENHSYQDSWTQIIVNMGALDTYKHVAAVDLAPYVSPEIYDPQRESEFEIEICTVDQNPKSYTLELPVLDDMANRPFSFMTPAVKDLQVVFNIYRVNSRQHGRRAPPIGTAVALLDSLKQGLGSHRESLIRDHTIPILEKGTMRFIGKINFYFLVIAPFPRRDLIPKWTQDLQLGPDVTLIGHRGIGQNDPSRRQLQIGENTLESFNAATALGASYIEFGIVLSWMTRLRLTISDVQLTKDHAPVIYHDFLTSETGIDAPLHTLTLEQFMYISQAQQILDDSTPSAENPVCETSGSPGRVEKHVRSRAHSWHSHDLEQAQARSLIERMKHTFEFKLNEAKGFDSYKGNIRMEYIQSSFTTLEELLVELPEAVSFDIEIKYPMLFEAYDWDMDTYAVEGNLLVDTVLEKVFRLAGPCRTIFFSSFSPEICILLSRKQKVYPVLFLTEAGHIISADARADSLQEAIHFAKAWKLPGVISRSQPLVMSAGLVDYVKSAELVCVSWGELNDKPEHARTQVKAGLDGIIVNSVNLIAKTLGKKRRQELGRKEESGGVG